MSNVAKALNLNCTVLHCNEVYGCTDVHLYDVRQAGVVGDQALDSGQRPDDGIILVPTKGGRGVMTQGPFHT